MRLNPWSIDLSDLSGVPPTAVRSAFCASWSQSGTLASLAQCRTDCSILLPAVVQVCADFAEAAHSAAVVLASGTELVAAAMAATAAREAASTAGSEFAAAEQVGCSKEAEHFATAGA